MPPNSWQELHGSLVCVGDWDLPVVDAVNNSEAAIDGGDTGTQQAGNVETR